MWCSIVVVGVVATVLCAVVAVAVAAVLLLLCADVTVGGANLGICLAACKKENAHAKRPTA